MNISEAESNKKRSIIYNWLFLIIFAVMSLLLMFSRENDIENNSVLTKIISLLANLSLLGLIGLFIRHQFICIRLDILKEMNNSNEELQYITSKLKGLMSDKQS